jgi:MFS family permease
MRNKSALILLLTANAVSGFAQGISMLAIPWYFAKVLQKSEIFAVIYGLATFATLFWGLYAGTLIDRYPRKKIFLVANIIGFLILGSVSINGFLYGDIPYYLIGVVFVATIFNYNIHYPTLYAFAQELSEQKNYAKTNSLIEIQGQATSVLAGAIAAVLLTGINEETMHITGFSSLQSLNFEPWKLHEIFLMDAFSYIIGFAIVAFIKYTPINKEQIETGKLFVRLKSGFRYLKDNPLVFLFGNASYSIFVVLLVEVHMLLPLYVTNHLKAGSWVYAGSEMIYSIGALLAGIFTRKIFKNFTTTYSVIILMITTFIVFVWCAFATQYWVLLVFSFILGLTNAGTRILRITWLFSHVPNNVIGRAGSVFQTINILLRTFFIALFSIPFFNQNGNIRWAYFICGVFVLLSSIPLILKQKELETL